METGMDGVIESVIPQRSRRPRQRGHKASWPTLVLIVTCAFAILTGAPDLARAAEESASQRERDESARRAEAAADDAWLAAREAERKERERRAKSPLAGIFVGGEVAYAAENFDDSILVKSSLAGAAFIGYRPIPMFAAELRYEGFDNFDLEAINGRGEIDGYAISINAKLYPLDGPIEPFIGFGVGGIHLDTNATLNSGREIREHDSDALLRFIGGIDVPLTEHVIVNLDAAYLLPLDNLNDFPMTMLGGGLTFIF